MERDREAGRDRRRRLVEVDLVRFRGKRLASGLFRHRPVKFIFELTRRRRRAPR